MVDDRPSFANPYTMTNAKEVICDSFPAAIEQMHPDEQDFVAIVTRGHKHDADCIRTLYASGITPAYMGLIGSKRRVAGLFENLCTEGIDRSFLDQIHTPIGLAIGAVTTDEIAISILSELILCRSRDQKQSLLLWIARVLLPSKPGRSCASMHLGSLLARSGAAVANTKFCEKL